jgi:uncharacterized oligopeptide transporter (OPT) family protein
MQLQMLVFWNGFLVLFFNVSCCYEYLFGTKSCNDYLDSIPGAVLATAIVRGGFRRNNLLEINMIQTTGAAKVFASVAIMPQMNVSWIGAVVI